MPRRGGFGKVNHLSDYDHPLDDYNEDDASTIVEENGGSSAGIITAVIVVIALLITVVVIVVYIRKRRARGPQRDEDEGRYVNGNSSKGQSRVAIKAEKDKDNAVNRIPTDPHYNLADFVVKPLEDKKLSAWTPDIGGSTEDPNGSIEGHFLHTDKPSDNVQFNFDVDEKRIAEDDARVVADVNRRNAAVKEGGLRVQ